MRLVVSTNPICKFAPPKTITNCKNYSLRSLKLLGEKGIELILIGSVVKLVSFKDAIIRKHVIVSFLKRQRNKNLSKESFWEPLKKSTRERLIRVGKDDSYDPKWGGGAFHSHPKIRCGSKPASICSEFEQDISYVR